MSTGYISKKMKDDSDNLTSQNFSRVIENTCYEDKPSNSKKSLQRNFLASLQKKESRIVDERALNASQGEGMKIAITSNKIDRYTKLETAVGLRKLDIITL